MDFCDKCGSLVWTEADALCVKCRQFSSEELDEHLDANREIREKWEREQTEMKRKLIGDDAAVIRKMRSAVENSTDDTFYIAGVDISFVKGDEINACTGFIIIRFPDLKLVYEDYQIVALTAPYIPGFLAFREADFFVEQYEKLKRTSPEFIPDVIFVDGNGLLHPREFGLACQLGVLLNKPCIGVAKTLFQVDGLEKNQDHLDKIQALEKGGSTFPLIGESGKTLGVALRSCNKTTNPIYISTGHKISLDSAIWLVHKCCQYRIPEPTRFADIGSREYLRVNFKG